MPFWAFEVKCVGGEPGGVGEGPPPRAFGGVGRGGSGCWISPVRASRRVVYHKLLFNNKLKTGSK